MTERKDPPLADATSFIETQFPVAKVSMESYKERKAGKSQTITSIGKWWGRKPLILVRATLLGILMPSSQNPDRDREIFLKILTMDKDGLQRRKVKSISQNRLLDEVIKLPPILKQRFLDSQSTNENPKLVKLSKTDRDNLQEIVFNRMPYAEKLEYCSRPENIEGPSTESWMEINNHLETRANSLPDLFQELSEKRFGHFARIGDAFCGGGSIPFEAARLGLCSYGSDLNPVAALLSWAAINIIGSDEQTVKTVNEFLRKVYDLVERQINEWKIEENSKGWKADAYLYCVEVIDPENGWKIPLAPNWIIAEKNRVIAKLLPDFSNKKFDIEIVENANDDEYVYAKSNGTIRDGRIYNPIFGNSFPVDLVRQGLRTWESNDLEPKPNDVFQERIYCIRWVENSVDVSGKSQTYRHYCSPSAEDLERERNVLHLLEERFLGWQSKGYLPKRRIEPGVKTEEPIRTRGWAYWHQLFNPRQLLLLGQLMETAIKECKGDRVLETQSVLSVAACADWNSKLCRWISSLDHSGGIGSLAQTFYNQALNTLYNYGIRPSSVLRSTFCNTVEFSPIFGVSEIKPVDARQVNQNCDVWITDPPYADAIRYEEISEFFVAWYENLFQNYFKEWYTDTKRLLAVRGNSIDFREAMLVSYKRLAYLMPDNGYQVVMFTHQDAAIWADLSLILWAAGLSVVSAWTIVTETPVGIKTGNFVQGTVLLTLRKRTETAPVFIDEISYKVESEVRRQLDSMTRLDDNSDPNFGDADYQLAAYAAALRVLTAQPIEEIDPEKEILRERKPGEVGAVEALIRRAVKIACDHLIPRGLPAGLWKSLGAMERFYLKGLEVEGHGEYRSGVYQELARGFGAAEYDTLLESGKANETRLKSASEFGKKMLGSYGAAGDAFADSLVRQCLFAVWLTVKNEDTRDGMNYLHTELKDAYWTNREKVAGVLDYLSALHHASSMEHWQKDAHAAGLLAGAVRNDHL